MKKVLLNTLLACVLSITVQAQFNSGSTGADGALDLSTMNCPTNVCEVQLPESGVLNYTTVNIPSGKYLKFNFNSQNTPVIMLAQGNVVISGGITLSAVLHTPGPGGFYGARSTGQAGFGPGGGRPDPNQSQPDAAGRWVGNLSLVPIIGGSGGGALFFGGSYGGGGGGAIVIASSASIVIPAAAGIDANGGGGYSSFPDEGSGGAIRLVANSINIAGNLSASSFYQGVIRLEAPQGQINFTGNAAPTPVFATINPVIIPVNPPTLRIAAIGGYAVPTYSAGRPDRVDLMLPSQLPDPINVQIQGSNVPSGTPVQLQLSGQSGTATGCTLTGGPGPVSCNGTITGVNRSGVSTLIATAVFTPPSLAEAFNPKGADQVAKVRLETALGGQSKYTFLRADGSVIETKKLQPRFLQQFGM